MSYSCTCTCSFTKWLIEGLCIIAHCNCIRYTIRQIIKTRFAKVASVSKTNFVSQSQY